MEYWLLAVLTYAAFQFAAMVHPPKNRDGLVQRCCEVHVGHGNCLLDFLGGFQYKQEEGTPKSSILIGFSIINHPFFDGFFFGFE